jgi:muramoyltetrapeptide carboxypeptidase
MTSLHGYNRPPRLRRGDTIGIVAPSSPQRDDERLHRGIRYFESLGYRVRVGEHLWKRYGYLAGSDDERIDDLNGMINDPEVRMIIAGRGGYGMTRIIDRVDYRALRRAPKIIVGFSDLTALNTAALVKSKLVTFSGAMAGVDFGAEQIDAFAEASFWRAVTSTQAIGRVDTPDGAEPHSALARGRAEGWLLCGNLTLIASLCGTPYLPKSSGAIMLIEEIGEEAYRVDRLLAQLWNSGMMKEIAGLALGAFTGTDPRRVSVDPLPIAEVFDEYVRRAGVPCISGVSYGHIERKLTLPLGVHATIDASRGTLRIQESGVS